MDIAPLQALALSFPLPPDLGSNNHMSTTNLVSVGKFMSMQSITFLPLYTLPLTFLLPSLALQPLALAEHHTPAITCPLALLDLCTHLHSHAHCLPGLCRHMQAPALMATPHLWPLQIPSLTHSLPFSFLTITCHNMQIIYQPTLFVSLHSHAQCPAVNVLPYPLAS